MATQGFKSAIHNPSFDDDAITIIRKTLARIDDNHIEGNGFATDYEYEAWSLYDKACETTPETDIGGEIYNINACTAKIAKTSVPAAAELTGMGAARAINSDLGAELLKRTITRIEDIAENDLPTALDVTAKVLTFALVVQYADDHNNIPKPEGSCVYAKKVIEQLSATAINLTKDITQREIETQLHAIPCLFLLSQKWQQAPQYLKEQASKQYAKIAAALQSERTLRAPNSTP